MQGDVLFAGIEKFRHFQLGEPDGLVRCAELDLAGSSLYACGIVSGGPSLSARPDPQATPKKLPHLTSVTQAWLRFGVVTPNNALLAVSDRHALTGASPAALAPALAGNGKQLLEKVLGDFDAQLPSPNPTLSAAAPKTRAKGIRNGYANLRS